MEDVEKMVDYVDREMQNFDILHVANLRKGNGVVIHFSLQFMYSNILLPLFHGHITKKKPQACMML
jgi:hypothetical protein